MPPVDLTPQERVKIALMCKMGLRRTEIAEQFGVKVHTVGYIWEQYRRVVERETGRKVKSIPTTRKGIGKGVPKPKRKRRARV